MPLVDLRPPQDARPDRVLNCTRCRADVGIHGDTRDLDPHTYLCCQCLIERAHDPDPEPVLRLVA